MLKVASVTYFTIKQRHFHIMSFYAEYGGVST